MQLKKRFLASILVLVVTTASIGIFFILTIFQPAPITAAAPIPEGTDWIFKLDLNAIGKETLYDILFQSKDEQAIASIRKIIAERNSYKTKVYPLGVSLKTNLVAYQITENNTKYTCFLVKLDRPDLFEKNWKKVLGKNQLATVKDNWGLIVSSKDSREQMKLRAEKWINSSDLELERENNHIVFHSNKNLGVNCAINVKQDKLLIDGTANISENAIDSYPFDVEHSGIYIHSAKITPSLQATLEQTRIGKIIDFTKVEGVSLNYSGVFLESEKPDFEGVMGILPIPQVNMVIHSNSLLNSDSIYNKFPKSVQSESGIINFGTVKYYIVQLDSKTVFVGINKTSVRKEMNANLFEISGDFTKMTTITSESTFVTAMATNAGPVRLTTSFLHEIKQGELIMTKGSNGKNTIKGMIHFKKGKSALSSFLRYGIGIYNLDLNFGVIP